MRALIFGLVVLLAGCGPVVCKATFDRDANDASKCSAHYTDCSDLGEYYVQCDGDGDAAATKCDCMSRSWVVLPGFSSGDAADICALDDAETTTRINEVCKLNLAH